MKLQPWMVTIQYTPGKDNSIAMLSLDRSGDWQRKETGADQTRSKLKRRGQQLVLGESCSLVLVLGDVRDQPSWWKREGKKREMESQPLREREGERQRRI